MKRRRIDPRHAKVHRSYSVEETARLFGVHRNTVRSWLRNGLKTIDGGRPIFVLGSELRRFLTERRVRSKRPTPVGMIFCLRCREPRRPAGDMVDYLSHTATYGNLEGICPDCGTMMYRRVNLTKLEAIRAELDVKMTDGGERIRPRKEASLNSDSEHQPLDHADAQS